MLGLIKRIRTFLTRDGAVLHFKDAHSAREYAAAYGAHALVEGMVVPCVVNSVSNLEDFGPIASVHLAIEGAPSEVPAGISRECRFPENLKGKLCAALIGPRIPIGDREHTILLIAELQNSLSIQKGWKVIRELR